MPISRILITGDLLRPHPADPAASESVTRVRWLEDLLRPPLSHVTGLPVARLACEEGGLDFAALYRDCALEPSPEAWAELYAGELPPPMGQRLLDACRDALVISLEMPPSMARLLASAGVPLLDAVVDPLRFLFDIPLAWRSPVASIRQALVPFGVTEYEVAHRVAAIRAKMRWLPAPPVPRGATLLLDQLPSDAAMIDPRWRRPVTWSDYVDDVRALQREGPVVWRPHPHNADPASIEALLGCDARVEANFYSLLAQDGLERVAAISSGGVVEARAFGKVGVHFMDRYAGIDVPGWGAPVPVIGHWVSPHFFSSVLSGVVATCPDAPTLPVERDFFRRANNTDWDFGWVDQVVERRHAAEMRRSRVDERMHALSERTGHLEDRGEDLVQRALHLEQRAANLEHHAVEVDRRSEQATVRTDRLEQQVCGLEVRAAGQDAETVMARQIERLRDAYRPRLRARMNALARHARQRRWRVGVLGAGEHTEWLLLETDLRECPGVVVFDRDPDRRVVVGRRVEAAERIPDASLDVVITSSLAFQTEMETHLRSLRLPGVRIVTCYPPDTPRRRLARSSRTPPRSADRHPRAKRQGPTRRKRA